jgi:hypothetical protein
MINKDKYYIKLEDNNWVHRSPLKCFINPILRFLQKNSKRKLLLGSKTEFDKNGIPRFKGYSFSWVLYK